MDLIHTAPHYNTDYLKTLNLIKPSPCLLKILLAKFSSAKIFNHFVASSREDGHCPFRNAPTGCSITDCCKSHKFKISAFVIAFPSGAGIARSITDCNKPFEIKIIAFEIGFPLGGRHCPFHNAPTGCFVTDCCKPHKFKISAFEIGFPLGGSCQRS